MELKIVANGYLAAALVLGAMLPVMLSIATSMNTYEFLFLAYLISVPASLVFVLAMGKKGRLLSYLRNKRDFAIIAAIGLLNYAFLEFGLSYAERFVSASLATVVYRTYPILMLLFLPQLLRERVSKYQVAALSLAFVGLYLAMTGGGIGILTGANAGIVLFLVAVALSSALATVLIKKYTYDMESSMFIFSLANFVFFTLLFISQGMPTTVFSAGVLLPLLYVGIVYNVLVGFMYYAALRMMKTTFVTNVYFLSPFITFVFSWLLLGEGIKTYYVAIAVLVAIGMLIQRLDKTGGSYASRKTRTRRDFVLFDITGAFMNSGEVGINAAIANGGRVLALKLQGRHEHEVGRFAKEGNYANVFTDRHAALSAQTSFVRDTLGAGDGEIVVVKAGNADECEKFFVELSDRLGSVESGWDAYLPNEQK